ncbi:hypothetical protein HPB47_019763 [Ixodes persulcatus]|uniref:Uncharacterized protein n=1 Tax=Ixodes persulcatus TaxID=34615 RepID=A0AC60QJQ4_IXOPE|nr:hypothetical protein HPB47_019763 [Ixodes persulcatus]
MAWATVNRSQRRASGASLQGHGFDPDPDGDAFSISELPSAAAKQLSRDFDIWVADILGASECSGPAVTGRPDPLAPTRPSGCLRVVPPVASRPTGADGADGAGLLLGAPSPPPTDTGAAQQRAGYAANLQPASRSSSHLCKTTSVTACAQDSLRVARKSAEAV